MKARARSNSISAKRVCRFSTGALVGPPRDAKALREWRAATGVESKLQTYWYTNGDLLEFRANDAPSRLFR